MIWRMVTLWDLLPDGQFKLHMQKLVVVRKFLFCLALILNKKFSFCHTFLARFYHSVIEIILCFGVSVWFDATASHDNARLERIVRQASRTASCDFPSIASLYDTRLCHRASKILVDSSHRANHLFELLPFGRRYRAIKAKTHQFRPSFFPEAIRVISPFLLLFRYMSVL